MSATYEAAQTHRYSGKGQYGSAHSLEKRAQQQLIPVSDCWYFAQPAGCKKGDMCDHKHTPKNG